MTTVTRYSLLDAAVTALSAGRWLPAEGGAMTPATAPNGRSVKKYGKQILNGASISGRETQGDGPTPGGAYLSREYGAGMSAMVPRTGDDGKAAAALAKLGAVRLSSGRKQVQFPD